MSFLNILDKTASVKRLTVSGNKEVYSASSSFNCALQPLSEVLAQQTGLDMTRSFRMYTEASASVTENDEVTIDSIVYKVRGIKFHDYGGTPHKSVLLEKK